MTDSRGGLENKERLVFTEDTRQQRVEEWKRQTSVLPMLEAKLCDVEGLPWVLRRWQLFLCRRHESQFNVTLGKTLRALVCSQLTLHERPSSTATDSASDGFSITRLSWPEKSMATRELSEMLLWNCGQTLQRYQSVHGGCEKTFHFRMNPIAFHHLWVDALNGGGQRRLLLVLYCPLVPVKMAPALLFPSDSRLIQMKDIKGALKWIGSVYVKTTEVNILITGRRKESCIKTDLFYKSSCLFPCWYSTID